MESPSITRLTATDVVQLDPCAFLALLGKRVIHPVGRRSSLRKMAWLMPRLQRAVPYLGYLLVVGEKPATTPREADEMAEDKSPERMS